MCAGSERAAVSLQARIRVENTDNNISPPGERERECTEGTSNDAETIRLQIPTKTYPDGFSHVSASVWRIKKRRSATDGRMERERGNGCTGERTGERFKEHPRTSSLFAKIALSAGKILLSQRATVNHRCESTKARLAAERKEGPITIDRATGKTASRRARRGAGEEDRERGRRQRSKATDVAACEGCIMGLRDANGRFEVSSTRNPSCPANMQREWKSDATFHGVLGKFTTILHLPACRPPFVVPETYTTWRE